MLFKEFIRSKKNKPFSFIVNCIGMSLAFAVTMVLFAYVRAELTHDSDVIDRKDIVRVKNSDWGIMPGAYGPWLAESLSEVEAFSRVLNMPTSVAIPLQEDVRELFTKENVTVADSAYPSVFSLQSVYGDLKRSLVTDDQVIISENTARRLFGEIDPIGKQIIIGGSHRMYVTAVFKDITNPALRNPSVIVNVNYINKQWMEGYTDSWMSSSWELYLKLKPNVDRNVLNDKYRKLYTERIRGQEKEVTEERLGYLSMENYEDIYFSTVKDYSQHGNSTNIRILLIIALLIVGVSIINYVNMATARLADKNKTIRLKRILGANRGELILSVVLDAIAICFFSALIAWCLVRLFYPYLSQWIAFGNILDIDWFSGIILFLFIPLVCGVLAGVLPAIVLFRSNKETSVNSYGKETPALRKLKSIMMVLQFTVSIGLIIASSFIYKQVHYMKNIDPGYDRNNIVVISGHTESTLLSRFDEFRSMLKQHSSVLNVAAAKDAIYSVSEFFTYTVRETPIRTHMFWVDEYFMELMGLELLEGEGFIEGGSNRNKFLINESLSKEIAALTKDQSYLYGNIVGVVRDFNFQPLHESISPLFLGYLERTAAIADVYIRIQPENIDKTLDFIEECYKKVYPATFYQYSFMDNDYARLYGDEVLFSKRLLVFAVISVIIACLGLLAFVIFYIEQKTKSIGIRKVLGATEFEIMRLLNRDFTFRMLLAFVIACPSVYFIIIKWQESFAYKAALSWWVFAVSFLIMLFIALLCVIVFTWQAATANPVDSIKSE